MSIPWDTIAKARERLSRERGTVIKDWGGRVPIALAFPNSYYLGMSSLAVHLLYRLLVEEPGIACERAFHDTTPIALESQRPLLDFAVLAFTVSYEMDYFNLVDMLRRASIPPLAQERDERYPLLLAGGPCVTANPEPLAPICDALVIGEGEPILPSLVKAIREGILAPRPQLLRQLATIPGIYVPHFYKVEYEGLRVRGVDSEPFAPYPVERQWVRDLDEEPAASAILTEDTEFGDMYLMEVARGCGWGCRFCLAGFIYRPPRERSLELLLAQAKEGLRYRQKIGLIGATLSDYSMIDALVKGLRELKALISISSLRADNLTTNLLEALAESGTETLTIAPEAGSERLRSCLNKGLSQAKILEAARLAQEHRIPQLKLYFMIGLPSETEEDMEALIALVKAIKARFSRHIIISLSCFVPKAQTPYQWLLMAPLHLLEERIRYVKERLAPQGIEVRSESPTGALIQATLARGDRRVGLALTEVQAGSSNAWRRALARQGVEFDMCLGERTFDPLPWDIVQSGVSKSYLKEEMAKGESTSPCPPADCYRCGVCSPVTFPSRIFKGV